MPAGQPVGVAAGSHASPASCVPLPQVPEVTQVHSSADPAAPHVSPTSHPGGFATGSQSSSASMTPLPQLLLCRGNSKLTSACTAAMCVWAMHACTPARSDDSPPGPLHTLPNPLRHS